MKAPADEDESAAVGESDSGSPTPVSRVALSSLAPLPRDPSGAVPAPVARPPCRRFRVVQFPLPLPDPLGRRARPPAHVVAFAARRPDGDRTNGTKWRRPGQFTAFAHLPTEVVSSACLGRGIHQALDASLPEW